MRFKNPAEKQALQMWQQGRPHSAMRILADAGYDRAARRKFLRKVVGLAASVADDYVEVG